MAGAVLPGALTAEALAAAMAEPHPDSLAAGTRLRASFGPDAAVAALLQATLRRAGRAKFGAAADALFFTRDGLEQATRPEIARWHAQRLVDSGADVVVDLGCGIGSDALAFADAGLSVVAVEADPGTAEVAAANLHGRWAEVLCAAAEEVAPELLRDGVAVFCDPARRSGSGRRWRLDDFSPPWDFVSSLLDGSRPAGVKLGPALPHDRIPSGVEAEWVSHRGDVVEVGLWAGGLARPGVRTALVWPDQRLDTDPAAAATVAPLGRYLYEPDGAVIRSGGVGTLARRLGAGVLDPHHALLTSDVLTTSPFATAFEVLDRLPYDLRSLREWVRRHEVGRLEIKTRGIEGDPAQLRARLRPAGAGSATLVVSRTPNGTVVAVVRRVPE